MRVHKICLLVLCLAATTAHSQNETSGALVKHDQPPTDADGRTQPVYAGIYVESMGGLNENDMAIKAQAYVESMGGLNENDMTVKLDMFFRMSWTDARLASEAGLVTDLKNFRGWKPDIVFLNEKVAKFHEVTVHNFAAWIDEEGTVAYSTRISMTVACPMNLAEYPLDSQACPLRIASYAHPFADMPLYWFPDQPIEYNTGITLPEFTLVSQQAAYCEAKDGITYTYAKTFKSVKQAKFGCLEARFNFERRLGYHLVQTYLPTCLIVMISWVGFWIDPGAVPARVTLSFTTLLTLTTLGSGIRFSLPHVSYAKAIDYWFMTCMAFVFASLAEFAFCNSYMRKAARLSEKSKRDDGSAPNSPQSAKNGADGNGDERTAMIETPASSAAASPSTPTADELGKRATKLDFYSRIMFPASWLLFNLVYWIYYMY